MQTEPNAQLNTRFPHSFRLNSNHGIVSIGVCAISPFFFLFSLLISTLLLAFWLPYSARCIECCCTGNGTTFVRGNITQFTVRLLINAIYPLSTLNNKLMTTKKNNNNYVHLQLLHSHIISIRSSSTIAMCWWWSHAAHPNKLWSINCAGPDRWCL